MGLTGLAVLVLLNGRVSTVSAGEAVTRVEAVAGNNAAIDAGASQFIGSWENPVSWTRGIVRIAIHQEHEQLKVQVWGRCHPTPCDWGVKSPELFIAHSNWKTIALRLTYGRDHEGIGTDLLLRLEPGPRLRAETYTTFTDDRKPYWAAYFLTPVNRPDSQEQ
jgi:hypothetical protein